MRKNKLVPYNPDYATPPGCVIEGYMESYGVDKEELARHLGLNLEETERLLGGNTPVTPEFAAVFGRLFHRPARFWLNMEALYQKDKRRLESRNNRRYTFALPHELACKLEARAKAEGVTPYRWIVNTLTRALEAPEPD